MKPSKHHKANKQAKIYTYVQNETQVLFNLYSIFGRVIDIFILLHIWQNRVRFGDFLPMRTLCDAYHKRSILDISPKKKLFESEKMVHVHSLIYGTTWKWYIILKNSNKSCYERGKKLIRDKNLKLGRIA